MEVFFLSDITAEVCFNKSFSFPGLEVSEVCTLSAAEGRSCQSAKVLGQKRYYGLSNFLWLGSSVPKCSSWGAIRLHMILPFPEPHFLVR